MQLKDLYKKYSPAYYIMVFGRPLKEKTTPFTRLPNKPLMQCEIVELKIKTKEYIEYGVSFPAMKPTKPIKRKGTIYVYVK